MLYYTHIVVDNLRVGGVQRLALDEAYSLSQAGKKVAFIVLEEPLQIDDMREIDGLYFQSYKIDIYFAPQGRIKQLKWFLSYLRTQTPNSVLSHSAKGIGLLRISRLILRQEFLLVGFIHQLASLSSVSQKCKRLLLFLMADQIRASSLQFILEFQNAYAKALILKALVLRKMIFDRMGIDLSRIEWKQKECELIRIKDRPALIFNSRVTEWKGFRTFVSLAERLGSRFQYILITSRMAHEIDAISRFNKLPTAQTFYGKSVADFSWETPSVHLYPTHYGSGVKYQQNIGLNVLECLSLGIPSVISVENLETWPELEYSQMIFMTEWGIEETCELVIHILESPSLQPPGVSPGLRELVGIKEHLYRLENVLS